ncbi:hypothetical protein AAG570_002689 [Ranatra chinensis]|uniref:C2H2-type domain-containing protein n=1 Tax=Ranatra chinensis TaxID=642074 RepID=A0ABD0YR20_9HEMI
MVVLENTGTVMSSTGHQYLQPDYLSPLPTTLDAKKSPLALLAQTCSQIGADSPNTKSLLPSLDSKPKKSSSGGGDRGSSTSPPKRPYEANVLTKKSGQETPKSEPDYHEKRRTPSSSDKPKSPDSGASPIIRSGLEVLQGLPHKDLTGVMFKPPLGLEANPAFRPPLQAPYVGYARVKTATGSEALVPVCKDPYCGGCQLSVHSAALVAAAGSCPSGCTHAYQLVKPYVCNWIAGDNYCGKRFTTSDELLQHLRTHTADSSAGLLNPLRYPNPPLSPLSASRYHPYTKPTVPPSIASPFSAFNPTALGPYYSPYALYGQRLGAAAAAAAAAAAVHP